jgi:ferredoxin
MAYRVERECSGCGMCVEVCPRECIADDAVPVRIDEARCVDCGVCEGECPLACISPPAIGALREAYP